jgi:hypothetical protein
MKKLYVTYLVVFISFHLIAQEKEQQVFMSGYVKNLHDLSFIDKLTQTEWTTLVHNRLNFKYLPSNNLSVRIEVRNRLFYGKGVRTSEELSEVISKDYGIIDMSWNLVDDENVLFNTTVDRALLNYTKGNWDITLGRQRVNWGMNLAWNPNDIFNTYNLLDFDYEERPGSDAVRIQYYLGDFSKIEVTAKKGRGGASHVAAAMYKFNKWSYDVQVFSGVHQKDWVSGVGWAGNLKNAGFKGEVSYFVPYENYLDSENTISASTSVDYVFKKGLYVNASMLYNSTTSNAANDLGSFIYSNMSAKNLMPFKYSVFLQLANEFSPIFRWNLTSIYAPTHHSVILMPSLNYAIATNWDFSITSQHFLEFEDNKSLANRFVARIHYSF